MSLKSTISKKVSVNLQTLRGQYPGTTTSFRHVDGDALSTARAQNQTLQQQAAAAFRVGGGGAIITKDGNDADITTADTRGTGAMTNGAGSDGATNPQGLYQRMAVPTNVSKWTGVAGGTPDAVAPDQRIPVDISLVLPGPTPAASNGVDRQVVTLAPTTPANVNRLDPALHYITVVPMVCATVDVVGGSNVSVSAGERAQMQPTVNIVTTDAATTAATITMERTVGQFSSLQLPFCNYILQVKDRPPTYLL